MTGRRIRLGCGTARTRVGDASAEVLLLDRGTDISKARAELDWHPSHSGLAKFRNGSYRAQTAEG
jgi:hypothetical protein